jgi:predicted nucleotidyltransferase
MSNKKMIEVLKKRLIEAYSPQAIYLFGSHAWGKPDSQSDFDILVVVDKSDEKPYKRAIKGMRSLNGLKISKDIVVYTNNEFEKLVRDVSTLCHKVKNEGVKLYEAA